MSRKVIIWVVVLGMVVIIVVGIGLYFDKKAKSSAKLEQQNISSSIALQKSADAVESAKAAARERIAEASKDLESS